MQKESMHADPNLASLSRHHKVVDRQPSGDMTPMVPEQPGGQRPDRPPRGRQVPQCLRPGTRWQRLQVAQRSRQRDVAGWKHIHPIEGEQQVDLGAPAAHALDRADGDYRRLVIQQRDPVGAERAVEESGREGAGMDDLRARQTGAAQYVIRQIHQAGGIKRAGDYAQPPPNGRRGLIADHLRHDRLQKAGKAGRATTPGQGTGAIKYRGEIAIEPDQGLDRGQRLGWRMREVGGRARGARVHAADIDLTASGTARAPNRTAYPTRLSCAVCGSMVNFATTAPSAVLMAKPI